MSPPCKHFKHGCNPNLSEDWSEERLSPRVDLVRGKCDSVGLCATPIIQLNYAVIPNHVYLRMQDVIKAANMVENCIKLRQDKVDYVHE